jgi:hypothetical protein
MLSRYALFGAILMAGLVAPFESAAWAAAPPLAAASAQTATVPTHHARASIYLKLGRSSAWVGQAIPITVSAQFRDVEGVTLEGSPQLKSDSVFVSDLAREPHQSTEVVDGQPILVATWAGTITPSTAGPIALSVELPVRIRFHEAVAQPPAARDDPWPADPFGDVDIDPSNPASIQRLFQSFQRSFSQPFEQSLGRAHDDALTLTSTPPAVEIKALPVAGQPTVFSGAVGRFDIRASVAAAQVRASEPVTLKVTVQGEGDLGRVDLPGIETSADWKAYPTTSKVEATPAGKRLGRKTFEQVLIPLHGGSLAIPPIALSVFDPIAGRYTTVETAPLTVAVEGGPAPATSIAPMAPTDPLSAAAAPDAPAQTALHAPSPSSLVESPRTLGVLLAPALAAPLAAIGMGLWRRRDEERSLRRKLRRAATDGKVSAFFDGARRLIALHFAKRWGISPEQVTCDALRQHLGPTAEPLVAALSAADAWRFGRRELEPAELGNIWSSVESGLRSAP